LAAGVDGDDVTGADLLAAGRDAVDHGIVHADAGRGRKAIQVQEVRSCAVAHNEIIDDLVDLCRGDPRLDRFAARLERRRADRAGTAHLFKFGGIFNLDHGTRYASSSLRIKAFVASMEPWSGISTSLP